MPRGHYKRGVSHSNSHGLCPTCHRARSALNTTLDVHMGKSSFISIAFLNLLLGSNAASAQAVDPGIRTVGSPGGIALAGASSTELQLWASGISAFGSTFDISMGLGPRFNGLGCVQCHTSPSIGGSSPRTSNPQVGMIQNFARLGGRSVLPPFIVSDGPIREARLKRKPNGAPDGSVHPLFAARTPLRGGERCSKPSAAPCATHRRCGRELKPTIPCLRIRM